MSSEPNGRDGEVSEFDATVEWEDVVGEPISREEASRMGLSGLEVSENGGTRFLRVDELITPAANGPHPQETVSLQEPPAGIKQGENEATLEDEQEEKTPAAKPVPSRAAIPGRRRLDFTGSIMWLVLLILLAAVAGLGLVALSVLAPEHYTRVRAQLPAAWTFLPKTEAELRSVEPPPANPDRPRTLGPQPFRKRPVAQMVALANLTEGDRG